MGRDTLEKKRRFGQRPTWGWERNPEDTTMYMPEYYYEKDKEEMNRDTLILEALYLLISREYEKEDTYDSYLFELRNNLKKCLDKKQ